MATFRSVYLDLWFKRVSVYDGGRGRTKAAGSRLKALEQKLGAHISKLKPEAERTIRNGASPLSVIYFFQ